MTTTSKSAGGNGAGSGSVAPVNPLTYLRTRPNPSLVGTINAGANGGNAGSIVNWNPSSIPEVPAWAAAIDLSITLPISVTVPADATASISEFGPYAAWLFQLVLAGSPEWPSNTSLVPFYLDNIANTIKTDPASYGPDSGLVSNVPSLFYGGPNAPTFDSQYPGAAIVNATAGPVTTTFTWQYSARIQLQRDPQQMWGCIPLGDPQNRPQVNMQLGALVGSRPEGSLVQDKANAGITAEVGEGGATVNLVFESLSTDILPDGTTLPVPVVGYGLNVTYDSSLAVPNAGAIIYQQQRTAMIYTAIHNIYFNDQAPINPDYIGLWLTQDQQSARYAFDIANGTLQDYYDNLRSRYGRYFPSGHVYFDMSKGSFPDFPKLSPYKSAMSPDAAYAAAAGVRATPNMSTAFRIPSSTDIAAAYVANYAFGLVTVPY
jgi:hypothetical protein